MQSADTIRQIGKRTRDANPNVVTPGDEYNQSHNETKWDRQMRVLKEHFGPSSILAVISIVASVITIVFLVGSPVVSQAGSNATMATGLRKVEEAVRENKDEQTRANANILERIEALSKQTLDATKENQAEMRSMRESSERQLIEVRQDTKALWNWMGELKNKITTVEAEIKKSK